MFNCVFKMGGSLIGSLTEVNCCILNENVYGMKTKE